METNEAKATKIAKLNDEFRKGYTFMMTQGIQAMPDVQGLIEAVRTFKNFSEDNDPYGEHDFGSFVCDGETVYWKIDYYDKQLKYSCDPLSPDCRRVLTIMLAEEY